MPEAIDQRIHLAEVAALAGLELDLDRVVLPRDRSIDANGLRLHFLEWGESTARPIILLHGGALTAHTWDVVCLGLLPEFRCIAPDLRGFGQSAKPDSGYDKKSKPKTTVDDPPHKRAVRLHPYPPPSTPDSVPRSSAAR